MGHGTMKRQACDACHQRKIHCDYWTAENQCDWCQHHGLTCTFTRVRGRRRKREKALARSEAAASASPSSTTTPSDKPRAGAKVPETPSPSVAAASPEVRLLPDGQPQGVAPSLGDGVSSAYKSAPPAALFTRDRSRTVAGVSYGQIHVAGNHVGHIGSHYGLPVFSTEGRAMIRALTGEEPRFQDPSMVGPGRRLGLLALSLAAPGAVGPTERGDLPSQETTESVFAAFMSSPVRLAFPIVDRVLFRDTIAAAYQPQGGQPSLEYMVAKASVLAFLSITHTFETDLSAEYSPYNNIYTAHDDPGVLDTESDFYAAAAEMLLNEALEHLSLTSLQTVVMLLLHHTFAGRFHSASMFHAVACRAVFMLGGHITMSPPADGELTRQRMEDRHLRSLFWLCYIFDKDMALRNGHPPSISDEFCDLTLPDGYADAPYFRPYASYQAFAVPRELALPHFPGDLSLNILKAKACRMLYSAEALQKSDAELLRDIRELDAELESWRMSIAPEFRPALSVSRHSVVAPSRDLGSNMWKITLQLEYHYLMTIIHRVVGRYYTWHPESTAAERVSTRPAGVESSLALSVEASRSTVIYLGAAVHRLASNAFWFVIFYPMAALMALFFSILADPLNPQASADVEHLRAAADVIRSMPIRRLTPLEVKNLKQLDAFIAELVRLCTSAIHKAKREFTSMAG